MKTLIVSVLLFGSVSLFCMKQTKKDGEKLYLLLKLVTESDEDQRDKTHFVSSRPSKYKILGHFLRRQLSKLGSCGQQSMYTIHTTRIKSGEFLSS